MQTVYNSSTYEILITSTSISKFIFPDDSILRGKKIVGVAIRNQNSAGTSLSPSGYVLVSNVALDAAFVNLYQDSKAILNNCPAPFFVPAYQQGEFTPVDIEQFSPSTSFIRFADTARIAANQVVEITFYYVD